MQGRQAAPNQGQRKSHAICSCAALNTSILPVHCQHYHPVCLHSRQCNQPPESAVKWIHCALREQFITIPGFTRGGCRFRSSLYQSSQAAAGGNLQGEDMFFFLFFFLFVSIKIFSPFDGRRYYYKGNRDEMKSICREATKTACRESSIVGCDWEVRIFADP